MVTVEQLIGNLLLRHNCVIIPSFGGFVAKPVSARIDYEKGTMLPPGKSLLFNRQLINNDGLLISEFANSNGVSYDEATKEVKSQVSDWNTALKSGGRIEIDNVGNLFFDEERNICFEQDRFCNLLLESFGLGTVHFLSEEDVQIAEKRISIQEDKHEPVIAPIVEEQLPEVEETPVIPINREVKPAQKVAQQKASTVEVSPVEDDAPRKRRAWRYVAAACILPIAFYSIWIPVKTDVLESGVISYRDFNPFHKQEKATYSSHDLSKSWVSDEGIRGTLESELEAVEGTADVYPFKFTEDTYIQVALPKVENGVPTEKPQTNTPETPETFAPNTMHYIVGCFGDKSNAENLVARLRANGLNAQIVDFHNGLHRVTAGGAISEEAYQNIKLKADSLGLSGWRLK